MWTNALSIFCLFSGYFCCAVGWMAGIIGVREEKKFGWYTNVFFNVLGLLLIVAGVKLLPFTAVWTL